ncbi:ATP-binding protein, partial [Bacteroidota bacterium]
NQEKSKVNTNVLVQKVISDLDTSIAEKKAQIDVENLPTITGYEIDLRLVIQNLISNAIKFSRPNTQPVIKISCVETKTEHQFEISDNGIGIDPKYFDQIFVIFKTLHGRSNYKGTGIGLAHCKKAIELQEGRIWVESKVNEGTSFFFTIPKNQ